MLSEVRKAVCVFQEAVHPGRRRSPICGTATYMVLPGSRSVLLWRVLPKVVVVHRMYVDEVGNADLGSSEMPNQRYLFLTGIIIEESHVKSYLAPEMAGLKSKYFKDEGIVFHRREMVRGDHPFTVLKDVGIRAEFNAELYDLLRHTQFVVITVGIDKLEHHRKYGVWRYHPYHYCMEVLLERYVLWLERGKHVGDVMFEARGKKEDRKLSESYSRLIKNGTDFVTPLRLQKSLTSKALKLQAKSSNKPGLQVADMLCHPAYRMVLEKYSVEDMKATYGREIAEMLCDSKYYKAPSGKLIGYGMKLLP